MSAGRAGPTRPLRLGASRGAFLGVALVLLAPVALVRGATPHARESRAAGSWSAAAVLAACPAQSAVRVVFPAASPFAATGPGAVMFGVTRSPCPGSARVSGIAVSRAGDGDAPGPPRIWTAPRGATLAGPTAAAGATDGDVVLTGAMSRPGSASATSSEVAALMATSGLTRGSVAEARPGGALGGLGSLHGPAVPVSATSAYLGDVALASVSGSPGGADAAIVIRMQRHYSSQLGPALVVADHQRDVTALTVALDYRTDAVVAWQAAGWLYARWVREGGRLGSLQRVARVGADPQLTATISDDDRAILAWLSQPPAGGPSPAAREYIDISAFGVRFGPPRLIESFSEPPRLPLGAGALRLTRLARESVMLAWTGMDGGRYVVRAAPVSLAGIGHVATISAARTDSELAAFVPGPRDEALALWTSAPRLAAGGADGNQVTILAAAGGPSGPGTASFGSPELVTGAAPNRQPDVAIDPASDRALAAWRVGGASPAVRYAVRAPG